MLPHYSMNIELIKSLWNIAFYPLTNATVYVSVFGQLLILAVILYVFKTLICIINRRRKD